MALIFERHSDPEYLQTNGIVVVCSVSVRAEGGFTSARDMRFLVDTGATTSCLRDEVAADIRPKLIGRFLDTDIIGGTSRRQEFLASISFRDPTSGRVLFHHNAMMTAQPVPGWRDRYEGLIGRDILSRLVLHYDGKAGSVTLSI